MTSPQNQNGGNKGGNKEGSGAKGNSSYKSKDSTRGATNSHQVGEKESAVRQK